MSIACRHRRGARLCQEAAHGSQMMNIVSTPFRVNDDSMSVLPLRRRPALLLCGVLRCLWGRWQRVGGVGPAVLSFHQFCVLSSLVHCLTHGAVSDAKVAPCA